MQISKNFNGKKILITGHTGFKGSWLSHILYTLNAELYGISLKPLKNSHYTISKTNKLFKKEFFLNIKSKKLKYIIKKIKPEIIIHLASQPIVSKSIENPKHTFSTNILGLYNLMEVFKDLDSVKFFLNVTSDKVYLPKMKFKRTQNPNYSNYFPDAQDTISKNTQKLKSVLFPAGFFLAIIVFNK